MIHVLDLPYMYSAPGVKYDKTLKVSLYEGDLPENLVRFKAEDFSYLKWVENSLNKTAPKKVVSKEQFKPFPHQKVAGKAILESYRRGLSGFFIADSTGTGKTISTLLGVTLAARESGRKRSKILVVCPKRVIPVWQQTIKAFASAQEYGMFMVVNYEQMNKLLSVPPKAKTAKKRGTKNRHIAHDGKPKINWDFVVFDESHYLKNFPTSNVSVAASNVAKLFTEYNKDVTPFTVFATATPGADPLNLAVMANLLVESISKTKTKRFISPYEWGRFLESEGFHVKEGKTGIYTWVRANPFLKNSSDPLDRRKFAREEEIALRQQKEDAVRIGRALKSPEAPFIMRTPQQLEGWPEQQFIPMPIELSAEQEPVYQSAWSRFRDWMKLPGNRNDPKGRLVETLRYRQKASFLKNGTLVDAIADFVEEGNQVYVSNFFKDSIDELKKNLEKKGIGVSELSGKVSADEFNENRLKFQRGTNQVAICSVVEGISLHAGETLPDGSKASMTPRVSIICDVRADPNKAVQSLGRAHRSGQNSLTYFPYFVGTVEYDDVMNFVRKFGNMLDMTGQEKDSTKVRETFSAPMEQNYVYFC